MHEYLIKQYNAVMTENSVCYFLGDMGMGGSEQMRKVIDRLVGTKILILGNHDKNPNTMYNSGFDVVLYNAMLVIANEHVTMSHCPLLGLYRENTQDMGRDGKHAHENWHGETNSKRRRFTMENRGQFHLHGHIHSPNGGKSQKILGRQYDVGVDANKFAPVSISTIESWIIKTKEKENE